METFVVVFVVTFIVVVVLTAVLTAICLLGSLIYRELRGIRYRIVVFKNGWAVERNPYKFLDEDGWQTLGIDDDWWTLGSMRRKYGREFATYAQAEQVLHSYKPPPWWRRVTKRGGNADSGSTGAGDVAGRDQRGTERGGGHSDEALADEDEADED